MRPGMSSNGEGSKLVTLEAAVAMVDDGSLIALGGMMLYRRPVAFCEALAGQAQDLTVITFSAGYETEMLLKGGSISTLRTCYAGMEYFGMSPGIRRAVERGELKFTDETELTLAAGLQASSLRIPWMPVSDALVNTDYPSVRPDFTMVVDPGTGVDLLGLPAISPDVCVLHVPYADPLGNAVLLSSPSLDKEFVAASDKVILSCDEVCSTDMLRRHGEVEIFGFEVDAVVPAAGGSLPCSSYPHYSYDGLRLLDYLEEI